MQRCEVLDPRVGHQLDKLIDCISSLEAYNQIAQIEVATTAEVVALVFRHLTELSEADQQKLIALGADFPCHIYLQSGGPETITLLHPQESTLSYAIPEFNIDIEFSPSDFTQINAGINEKMISRAIQLLELDSHDKVLDLFCGVGNFSLPMAQRAGHVVGVEGSAELVQRAQFNAQRNQLQNVEFYHQDLASDELNAAWADQSYNKILIDPARPGALEILPFIASKEPGHIVYVSCNPATLARDAGELVNRFGYQLKSAGVMDMFPHTAHVESMALFVKN
jgi:23S rRNA (uracil1939-C5)-methyltransferase